MIGADPPTPALTWRSVYQAIIIGCCGRKGSISRWLRPALDVVFLIICIACSTHDIRTSINSTYIPRGLLPPFLSTQNNW